MKGLLIPVKKYTLASGRFTFPVRALVSGASEADALPVSQLTESLRSLGVRVQFKTGQTQPTLLMQRNKSMRDPEAYRMTISRSGIEIISGGDAGAYYAIQTLREMIRIKGRKLPCCRIDDAPTFVRRGVYYDCARGKIPTVATLKELAQRLAQWKVNELQLYVENGFTFPSHPKIGRGFSPFTPDDLTDIREHCKKHHIRLVPSLASFGHMERILCLPEYAHLGELPGYRNLPGGTTLYPGDPGSIKLVADLFEDFLPCFDVDDFNVCGDEPWELCKGRSKRRAQRVGGGKVYLDFILKIHDLCLKHNRRMNMWGDIVLAHPEIIPQIPKDIVLLNWDYRPNGARCKRTNEFAQAGLPLVCCPGTHGWQSHGTRMSMSMENVSQFGGIAKRYKAEGFLNTDWGDSGHRNLLGLSLSGFAHGAAHAWQTGKVDDAKHVRNFVFHTYGDRSGKLADAIQKLGNTGVPDTWGYHVLVEGLKKPNYFFKGVEPRQLLVEKRPTGKKAIQKRLSDLSGQNWASPQKGLASFEALALQEYGIAAEMERLAWMRMDLAQRLRKGDSVQSRELRVHASQMTAMSKRFSELWLARNRKSRLDLNLKAFKAAAQDSLKLAKK